MVGVEAGFRGLSVLYISTLTLCTRQGSISDHGLIISKDVSFKFDLGSIPLSKESGTSIKTALPQVKVATLGPVNRGIVYQVSTFIIGP